MIGRLRGIVESNTSEAVILDVGGVGYELTCSLTTSESLAIGEMSTVEVYTYLREDHLSLFGFASKLEKALFLALISVNGVGPKMAIKILSGAAIEGIARAIEMGDVKALSQLPKVGKKTAEQLIVSLKGKLGAFLEGGSGDEGMRAAAQALPLKAVGSTQEILRSDIGSALINLGFRAPEVERVMEQMPKDLSVEAGVRYALQTLGGMR